MKVSQPIPQQASFPRASVADANPLGFDVAVGEVSLERPVLLWADVLQAIDRPDRCELAVSAASVAGPGGSLDAERLARIEREQLVSVRWRGQEFFEGRLDRGAWHLDPVWGRYFLITAYAAYHFLRPAVPKATYYQVTDSELAERLAGELELVAVVDSTRATRSVVERHEDPLRFLRRRAIRCERQLAVTDGRLYFVREFPSGAVHDLRGVSRVWSTEIEYGARSGRGGELLLRGDVSWKPLVTVDVAKLGEAVDGRYRVARCHHRLDAQGFSTRVTVVDDGVELFAWLSQWKG